MYRSGHVPRRVLVVGVLLVVAVAPGLWRLTDGDDCTPLLVGMQPDAGPERIAPTLNFFGASVTRRIDHLSLIVVQPRPGGESVLIDRLHRNPAVRYITRDEPFAVTTGMPSDPLVKDQWNLLKVRAHEAWDMLPKGSTTIVAVLDTGIDYTHPDLAPVISPAACNALAGRCPEPSGALQSPDLSGHGTHVAGIIGAVASNGMGVAGVAGGRVILLPITVGTRGGVVVPSAYLQGIVYAVDHGAKVINMSFGAQCGRQAYDAYRDAISYAEAHGVLIVTSAGNTGPCYEGRYPQTDPRVLAVAASDSADIAPPWTDQSAWTAVAAPGVRVLSTLPMRFGGYGYFSGTSQAAPHVAAAAALLFQVPGATKAKVVEWIKATCDPMPINVQCGGRLNIYRAVTLATTGIDPGPQAGGPAIPEATAAVATYPDGDE